MTSLDKDYSTSTKSCQTIDLESRSTIFSSNETTLRTNNNTIRSFLHNKRRHINEMMDSLSSTQKGTILTIFMFVFFGAHNLLQEAIMAVPGFEHGVMLGYLEVLGVTICSFLERKYVSKETERIAPLSAYPTLTLCLLASSSLSNMSLNYINFPTKVVFRSCKLIPTMVISTIMNRRIFSSTEYLSAIAISIGLVIFAAADWNLTPSFNPIGLLFVILSVIADAILPNAQERLFRLGSSRLEVTYFTNVFTLIAMTISTGLSGALRDTVVLSLNDGRLATYVMVYVFVAYLAISTFMTIVKTYGGVAAVLLATARKAMTLILSFIIFPKPFSWYYVCGAILVLGGLMVASLAKQLTKKEHHHSSLSNVEVDALKSKS